MPSIVRSSAAALLAAAALVPASASAQQGRPTPLRSPEVHTDRTPADR